MAKQHLVVSKAKRDAESYVADRVQHKINVYDRLAHRYRAVYWALASTSAIGAVLVPALVNFEQQKWPATAVSLMVAIVIALEKIFRPREIWRNYDLVAALLREEEMKFSTRSGPYAPGQLASHGKDGTVTMTEPFEKFVERIEDAIRREREETILMRTTSDARSNDVAPGAPSTLLT